MIASIDFCIFRNDPFFLAYSCVVVKLHNPNVMHRVLIQNLHICVCQDHQIASKSSSGDFFSKPRTSVEVHAQVHSLRSECQEIIRRLLSRPLLLPITKLQSLVLL